MKYLVKYTGFTLAAAYDIKSGKSIKIFYE